MFIGIKSMKRRSRLIQNRERKGYIYVLPFFIGFVAFILVPMVTSFVYSFNDIKFDGVITMKAAGLNNYRRAFLVDTEYRKMLVSSLTDLLMNTPIILIFSMLVALFLNGSFPGRSVFQMIFFVPIFVSSGILSTLFAGDRFRASIVGASSVTGGATNMFNTQEISTFLLSMDFPAKIINYIMYAITNILTVMNSSGIQILVFLIAIKSIPSSLYEASEVEGATPWENFWKITFPMVLPLLLVNVVYTVIDLLVNNTNSIMETVYDYNFSSFQFGYAAALSWSYFAVIILALILFSGIVLRFVRYYE